MVRGNPLFMADYKKGLGWSYINERPLGSISANTTSKITEEHGCSTEIALFSGGSHFEDNKCNMSEYAKSLFSTRCNWKTI